MPFPRPQTPAYIKPGGPIIEDLYQQIYMTLLSLTFTGTEMVFREGYDPHDYSIDPEIRYLYTPDEIGYLLPTNVEDVEALIAVNRKISYVGATLRANGVPVDYTRAFIAYESFQPSLSLGDRVVIVEGPFRAQLLSLDGASEEEIAASDLIQKPYSNRVQGDHWSADIARYALPDAYKKGYRPFTALNTSCDVIFYLGTNDRFSLMIDALIIEALKNP